MDDQRMMHHPELVIASIKEYSTGLVRHLVKAIPLSFSRIDYNLKEPFAFREAMASRYYWFAKF